MLSQPAMATPPNRRSHGHCIQTHPPLIDGEIMLHGSATKVLPQRPIDHLRITDPLGIRLSLH